MEELVICTMNVNNASAETTRDFLRTLDLESRSRNTIYVLTETNQDIQRMHTEKGNVLPKNWAVVSVPPLGHNGGVSILYKQDVWKTKMSFKPEKIANKKESIVHMALFRTIEPNPPKDRINSIVIWGVYLNPLQISNEEERMEARTIRNNILADIKNRIWEEQSIFDAVILAGDLNQALKIEPRGARKIIKKPRIKTFLKPKDKNLIKKLIKTGQTNGQNLNLELKKLCNQIEVKTEVKKTSVKNKKDETKKNKEPKEPEDNTDCIHAFLTTEAEGILGLYETELIPRISENFPFFDHRLLKLTVKGFKLVQTRKTLAIANRAIKEMIQETSNFEDLERIGSKVEEIIVSTTESRNKISQRKYLRNNKKIRIKIYSGEEIERKKKRQLERAKQFANEMKEMNKTDPKGMWRYFKLRVQAKENTMEDVLFEGKSTKETRNEIISDAIEKWKDPLQTEIKTEKVTMPKEILQPDIYYEILKNINVNKAVGGDFLPPNLLQKEKEDFLEITGICRLEWWIKQINYKGLEKEDILKKIRRIVDKTTHFKKSQAATDFMRLWGLFTTYGIDIIKSEDKKARIGIQKTLQEVWTGISQDYLKEGHLILLRVIERAIEDLNNPNQKEYRWGRASRLHLLKKKDKATNSLGDLRPIMIGSLGIRIIEKFLYITTRLLTKSDYDELVGEFQFGFRPRESCHGNIIKLMEQANIKLYEEKLRSERNERRNKGESRLAILFVDFAGAYDSIFRKEVKEAIDKLWELIVKKYERWDENTRQILYKIYLESQFITLINEEKMDRVKEQTIAVRRGVPQGGVLSPLLFNMVVKKIQDRLKSIKGLYQIWWADDLAMIGKIKHMKEVLELINKEGNDLGMKINMGKGKTGLLPMANVVERSSLLVTRRGIKNSSKTPLISYDKSKRRQDAVKDTFANIMAAGNTLNITNGIEKLWITKEYKYLGVNVDCLIDPLSIYMSKPLLETNIRANIQALRFLEFQSRVIVVKGLVKSLSMYHYIMAVLVAEDSYWRLKEKEQRMKNKTIDIEVGRNKAVDKVITTLDLWVRKTIRKLFPEAGIITNRGIEILLDMLPIKQFLQYRYIHLKGIEGLHVNRNGILADITNEQLTDLREEEIKARANLTTLGKREIKKALKIEKHGFSDILKRKEGIRTLKLMSKSGYGRRHMGTATETKWCVICDEEMLNTHVLKDCHSTLSQEQKKFAEILLTTTHWKEALKALPEEEVMEGDTSYIDMWDEVKDKRVYECIEILEKDIENLEPNTLRKRVEGLTGKNLRTIDRLLKEDEEAERMETLRQNNTGSLIINLMRSQNDRMSFLY